MTASLHLDGKQVKGHELKISVSLPLASEDVSGQSSKTTKVEKGDKGKTVSVDLIIKFSNAKDLTALITLAEAKNGSDERVIYPILERTANAMNVHQVKFDGNLIATEDGSLECWKVSFSLAEYNSVPEKKEERALEKKKAVAVQKSSGKAVSAATSKTSKATTVQTTPAAQATPAPAAPQKAQELTGLEKILKSADDMLAKK